MANYHGLLPEQSEAIVDQRGIITRKFRDFLADLATSTSDAALQAQITALDARVAALEDGGGGLATFVNGLGIQIVGQITDPTVRISLSAYLADLLDVSDAAPAEGDRLTWDATLALWKPAPDPTPVAGEILIQDGSSAPPVMLTNEAEDDFLYGDT